MFVFHNTDKEALSIVAISTVIALIILLLQPVCLRAYDVPKVCQNVQGAAFDAVAAHNDKKVGEYFRKALAPRSSIALLSPDAAELLRSLYEIVDDAFRGYELDSLTYPTYKAEMCSRRLHGKPVPADFNASQPKLLICAKKARQEATQCAMVVAGADPTNDDA
jgi:hypothetical protein